MKMDVRMLLFSLTLIAVASRATYGNPTIRARTAKDADGNLIDVLICNYLDPNRLQFTIRWLRNGEPVANGNQKRLKTPYTALYTCVVIGNTNRSRILTTSWLFDKHLEAWDHPVITRTPKKDIKVGDTVKLTCSTKKSDDKRTSISWYRNNFLIEPNLSQSDTTEDADFIRDTLTITIRAEENGAEYLCLVTQLMIGGSTRNYYPVSTVLKVQPPASKGSPKTTTTPTSNTTATTTMTTATKVTPESSSSGDVIQAVTLTFIFVLVVAVVVLGFFFIRLKRRVPGKQTESAQQMNEINPPSSATPPDDFNEYAHIGRVHQSNDEYRSFDYGHSARGHGNAAFERDSADYTEYEADGTPLDRDPQGRLEDGYEGKGSGETPEYMDLEQEATTPSSYENTGEQGEEPGYSLEGAVPSPLGGAGDVDDYEYSTPENVQNDYSLVEAPKPTSEDADDYSQPYSHPQTAGSKMAAGTKMAAGRWHGNAPSGDEDDDYNRLDHPNLKKPW